MIRTLLLGLLLALPLACSHLSTSIQESPEKWVLEELRAHGNLPRPYQARLTGFAHQPFKGVPQVVSSVLPSLNLEDLARWQAPFEEEPEQGWSVASHHTKAVTVLLFEPGKESLGQARQHLETAVTLAPQESTYWNDLAAVAWAQSQIAGDQASLSRAYEAMGRVLEIAPDHDEARFNQGLILQSLGLFEKAKQHWQQYLELDADQAWRAEAGAELRKIMGTGHTQGLDLKAQLPTLYDQPLALAEAISKARTKAWQLFERDLLPSWGDGAEAALVQAYALAQGLFELNGDRLYQDALEPILNNPNALGELRKAHRLFASGYRALEGERLPQAKQDLNQAFSLLEMAESPFRFRVAYYLALIDQLQGQYAQAAGTLGEIIEVARAKNYLNLMGEALWVKGQCESYQGKPDQALKTYQAAVPVFQALEGIDNLCGIYYKVATSLIFLGEQQQGWRELSKALQLLPRVTKPLRVYQVYMLAADAAFRSEDLGLARDYQRAALHWATTSGSEWALATAELWGARLDFLLGDRASAEQTLQAAQKRVAQFPSPSLRQQMEADCLAVGGDMAQNAAGLEAALEKLDARNNRVNRASLLCSLARMYLQQGRSDDAVQCLEKSLAIYESYRPGLSEQLRARFFNDIEGIFDEMISLRIARGEFEAAFDYQESKRARLLLDQASHALQSKSQTPENWQKIQASLGNQALLVFALTDQHQVVWLLSKDEFRMHRLDVSLEALEKGVALFRTQMERRAPLPRIREQGMKLYQWLFAPLEASLERLTHVTVVADGPLHGLPFAALSHPSKGYLSARMVMSAAPSANMFLQSLALRKPQLPAARVLLIGNPQFEPLRFPQLPQLGLGEYQTLEKLYASQATGLVNSKATTQAFFAQAPKHQIIHFNGHAIVNGDAWPRSMLVFAPDGENAEGTLLARDLAEIQLPETQLAILSACSTGYGTPTGAEGIANLARPFLAAGVPAVVASLWDVADAATTELMTRFHQYLIQGLAPDDALAASARQLMQAQDRGLNHPAVWSSFVVYGHTSGFRFEKVEKKLENSSRRAVHGENR